MSAVDEARALVDALKRKCNEVDLDARADRFTGLATSARDLEQTARDAGRLLSELCDALERERAECRRIERAYSEAREQLAAAKGGETW